MTFLLQPNHLSYGRRYIYLDITNNKSSGWQDNIPQAIKIGKSIHNTNTMKTWGSKAKQVNTCISYFEEDYIILEIDDIPTNEYKKLYPELFI